MFQKKESQDILEKQMAAIKAVEAEKERLKHAEVEGNKASNRVTELEEELQRLRQELEQERGEKQDLISEKELMKKNYDEVMEEWNRISYVFSSVNQGL